MTAQSFTAPETDASASAGRSQLLASGLLTAAFFVAGFVLSGVIPGGGTTKEQTVTDFYDTATGSVYLLFLALVAAAVCMTWFFTVLGRTVGSSTAPTLATRLALIGAGLMVAGGAILLGPLGEIKISGLAFIGVPTAVAIAQSGLGVTIGGVQLIAIGVIVLSLGSRRVDGYPSWLVWAGVVIGALALLGSVIWSPAILLALWFLLAAVGVRGPAR